MSSWKTWFEVPDGPPGKVGKMGTVGSKGENGARGEKGDNEDTGGPEVHEVVHAQEVYKEVYKGAQSCWYSRSSWSARTCWYNW